MMSKFKGFDRIAGLNYSQRVFVCDGCSNQCDVTQVSTDDGELYHGDRCERYSGLDRRETTLPDFFKEREKLLMGYHQKVDGERIGLARVGLLNEFFPFFGTFLGNLGFYVVLSEKTSKRTVARGVKNATAEFCFPFKVAFGHYADLGERVDLLFVPDIVEACRSGFSSDGQVRDTEWTRSFTCPYVHNFHSVIASELNGVRIINPHLSFREGSLEKELSRSMPGFTRREIRRAVSDGKEAYFEFKQKVRERGEEVLRGGERGIVLVGRPYSASDAGMNLGLAKKILNLGFLAIPQDFLPFPGEDLSRRWRNEFAIQGQLLLGAASVIRASPNLEAIFLDYFGCGPDSFIKDFFAAELGEKSCLTLQIDEHTADAGLVTRLEAFLDSLRW